MAVTLGVFSRYTVTCDDPHHKGCRNKLSSFGKDRTRKNLDEKGWYWSEKTDKFSCPDCVQSFQTKIQKGFKDLKAKQVKPNKQAPVVRQSTAVSSMQTSGSGGDPFDAALYAMMLGGDPFDAAMATWLSGSTSFGVLVGVMAGHHEQAQSVPEPVFDGRGDFGGAGASNAFDVPPDQQAGAPIAPASESEDLQNVPVAAAPDAATEADTAQDLPVVADPYAAEQEVADQSGGQAVSIADDPPSAEISEAGSPDMGSPSADTDNESGTAY